MRLLFNCFQVVAAAPKDMRMYYHSYDTQQQRFVGGWASSPDGFKYVLHTLGMLCLLCLLWLLCLLCLLCLLGLLCHVSAL